MEWTERQYERLARWLDGESVELSVLEQAQARAIERQEQSSGAMLDVQAPQASLDRVRAKMMQALAQESDQAARLQLVGKPIRRTWPRVWKIGVSLAAAAAIVLAVVIGWQMMLPGGPQVIQTAKNSPSGKNQNPPPRMASVDVTLPLLPSEVPGDPKIELLAREIDETTAEFYAPVMPAPVDVRIDAIQNAVDEFWTEPPGAAPVSGPPTSI